MRLAATAATAIIVLLFFVAVLFIEYIIPTFFVAFVEEGLGKLIPLLIALLVFRVNWVKAGLTVGITFGVLEVLSKVYHLSNEICNGTCVYFSWLMIVPVLAVHIPNALIQAKVIDFCRQRGSYELVIPAYVICSLYHWLYNANLYVI
ncbi:hypothetical protein DRP04_00010 [Archaeoglobales archaeon]|nr:MAG: hypothetical protein DRP04_00010 [Archaeoglobales archaeon]